MLLMGVLPTRFPVKKEARAGHSPMDNVTHNPVQATEAWFMRSTCCFGALGEESRGVCVSRMGQRAISKDWRRATTGCCNKKGLENLSKNIIPDDSAWFHNTMFYSTTCTCIPLWHINQFHINPHLIVLFHTQGISSTLHVSINMLT
jgi:hypothetical protein